MQKLLIVYIKFFDYFFNLLILIFNKFQTYF